MQFEVNVLGMADVIHEVIPVMQRQRSGHVINMSSYASRIAVPPMTVYAATKYAVEGLSDGLRRELAPWGIQVTRVHPASVGGTEFNQRAAKRGGFRIGGLPMARMSREQVAGEIVGLIRSPKHELFLGRGLHLAVFANRAMPELVDGVLHLWVRVQRRSELRDSPTKAVPRRNVRQRRSGVQGPNTVKDKRQRSDRLLISAALAVAGLAILRLVRPPHDHSRRP
jgi:short-subunit dehydrogenase